LILVRPFDRVKVNVPNFIADKKFFCIYKYHRVSYRAAAVGGRSKTNIRDWRRLLTVKTWVGIQWTPEGDPSISATNG
jgi:hypothetical protein